MPGVKIEYEKTQKLKIRHSVFACDVLYISPDSTIDIRISTRQKTGLTDLMLCETTFLLRNWYYH